MYFKTILSWKKFTHLFLIYKSFNHIYWTQISYEYITIVVGSKILVHLFLENLLKCIEPNPLFLILWFLDGTL